MTRVIQLVLVGFLLGVAAPGFSQNSASQYGQRRGNGLTGNSSIAGNRMQGAPGGFGGFRGGGGFNYAAPSSPLNPNDWQMTASPDDEANSGTWDTKSAVLSPGDRVEYKLEVKAGQTIMAGVVSDAFDPALELNDPAGKTIAKNDDRVDGDQRPFLSYHFASAGKYLLRVVSYSSKAGGKFTIHMKMFTPFDMTAGKVKHEGVSMVSGRIDARISAKKNAVYDLRDVFEVLPTYQRGVGFERLIGPTGVAAEDFKVIQAPGSAPVFKALKDGDFYAEYNAMQGGAFQTDMHEVEVQTVKTNDQKVLVMKRGDLDVLEMPVKKDQIVRTTFSAKSAAYSYELSGLEGAADLQPSQDPGCGNSQAWAWFKSKIDSNDDVTRVFHEDGTVMIAIRDQADQTISVTNSESIPEWGNGKDESSKMQIGETKLYVLKSTKSELMRVYAAAEQFLIRMDIFDLDGNLANSLCDRTTRKATDDLYFPDAKTYIVRLICDGFGGSGEYQMRRQELLPQAYTMGQVQTLNLDGQNFGLYSVNLDKGKRYELMTDLSQGGLEPDLLDDDGQFIQSQPIVFDKVEVQYFTAPASGHYRLWLRGGPGLHHFKFQLHTEPSLGGG